VRRRWLIGGLAVLALGIGALVLLGGSGEAEGSYPLAFEPGSRRRPPDPWTPDRIAEALAEHRTDIDDCGANGGGYRLTMTLDRGGRVAAAGVSYSDPQKAAAAECVARAATA